MRHNYGVNISKKKIKLKKFYTVFFVFHPCVLQNNNVQRGKGGIHDPNNQQIIEHNQDDIDNEQQHIAPIEEIPNVEVPPEDTNTNFTFGPTVDANKQQQIEQDDEIQNEDLENEEDEDVDRHTLWSEMFASIANNQNATKPMMKNYPTEPNMNRGYNKGLQNITRSARDQLRLQNSQSLPSFLPSKTPRSMEYNQYQQQQQHHKECMKMHIYNK